MDKETETAPFLQWFACVGELRSSEQSIPVTCDVAVAPDGEIALRFKDAPYDPTTARFQADYINQRGLTVPYYTLDVRSDSGDWLRTEHTMLTSVGNSSTPEVTVVRMAGRAASLSVSHKPSAEWEAAGTSVTVAYHTVGLRGFGTDSSETDIGRVRLQAPTEVKDYNVIAGLLLVENAGEDITELATWLQYSDSRVRDMLLMISLGAGRFVGWSVRELFVGGIRRSIECRGRRGSGQPYDPLFHHLNLEAALQLATKHYSRELGERTGLEIAIEWYVMNQSYAEARYLATMTALEHIVAKHAGVLGAMLPSETFHGVRDELDGVLAAPHTRSAVVAALRADGLAEDELSAAADRRIVALRSKLGGLNSPPLQDRIITLLSMYGVHHADVTPTVKQLIGIRNRLVHQGLHRREVGGVPLATAVAALRELVRRLLLGILDYEGPYQSYLNGPATAHFARRPS